MEKYVLPTESAEDPIIEISGFDVLDCDQADLNAERDSVLTCGAEVGENETYAEALARQLESHTADRQRATESLRTKLAGFIQAGRKRLVA